MNVNKDRRGWRSVVVLVGALGLISAAAGGIDAAPPSTDPPSSTGPAGGGNAFGATLTDGEFGETYNPDPDLLAQALGGVASLPDDAMVRDIILASIARASLPVDEAKALECWQNNGCDTGTGGELVVGGADGFGGNVSRQLFKMEFILQALTYPEIGRIVYTDANLDTQKAISDVRSMVAQDVDVIVSYPDAGEALVPAYREATERGIRVVLWANAGIGEPGSDYLTFTGTDQCALGTSYAAVMNEALPDGGQIAFLGGTPGNTQSPQWEECERDELNSNIEVVATADTNWTRQGALEAASGIISQYPELDGWSHDYGDSFVGVLRAYEAADRPLDFVATVHSDDNPLMCAWREIGDPDLAIYHFVAFFAQGRISLTAAMMDIAGAEVPPELIVGASLKRIDENSCSDELPDEGSASALISPELQSEMYPG